MNIIAYTKVDGGDWIEVTPEDHVIINWSGKIDVIRIISWEYNIVPATVKLSNGAIYDNLKTVGWQRRLAIKETREECPVPSETETDPAKKIADEQKYMICRFGSIKKQLDDLQIDLARKGYAHPAGYVRSGMRDMKEAENDYLLKSRKYLSDIVNTDKKPLPFANAEKNNVVCRKDICLNCIYPNCSCPSCKQKW